MPENKALSFEIVEGDLVIKVDPNKNGKNLIELKIDLAEVPAEIMSVLKK